MTSLTYRRPAELEKKLNETRAENLRAPASGLMHDGRLNFGPAVLLASVLSAGCWALIGGVGFKLFH